MSIDDAQKFMEKVKHDEDLQALLNNVSDNESKLQIAKDAGFDFTIEEAKKAKEELSEDDLDSIAGGSSEYLFGICCPREAEINIAS